MPPKQKQTIIKKPAGTGNISITNIYIYIYTYMHETYICMRLDLRDIYLIVRSCSLLLPSDDIYNTTKQISSNLFFICTIQHSTYTT